MSRRLIYLVDDKQSFIDSVSFLLDSYDYSVVAFTSPKEALVELKTASPDVLACLLLDVRMPEMSGLDLHEELRSSGVDLPVIYLTGHGDVPLAVTAMEKGAITFLEKPVRDDQLLAALDTAMSASVQSQRLSVEDRALAAERSTLLNELTVREGEVLNGIVNGLSGRQIAEQLGISPKTVDFHRTRVMRKLKVSNLAQLQRAVATASLAI